MRITIPKDSMAGDIEIPAGEYWVSVITESSAINLAGQGKDRKIPAIRRRTAGRVPKTTSVSFYSGGGQAWSLVVATPKYGEFVALIDVGKSKDDRRKPRG